METVDNIIQQKINSVDDLPDGYQPNLDSKWELLSAALPTVEKQRKLSLVYIKRISSVAALLLMIGGSWLIMIRKPQATKPKVVVVPHNLEHKIGSEIKIIQPTVSYRKQNQNKKFQPIITGCEAIEDEPVLNDMQNACKPIEEETPEIIVAVKPAHFTEVDFTEPILSSTPPTESVVKAQRFKFKLGGWVDNGAQAGTSAPQSFSLKTAF